MTKVTDPKDMWKANIEAVYREKNPTKFDNIPALIEKYIPFLLSQIKIMICVCSVNHSLQYIDHKKSLKYKI